MFLAVFIVSLSLIVCGGNHLRSDRIASHAGSIFQRRGGHGGPPLQIVPRVQDVDAAVRQIFGRPEDPEARQGSASRAAAQAIDEVEDALERANSARNATPPRYRDAEMKYGLAARLNPRDPRPLMGVGNVSYDQKQYATAAKAYQQALTMVTSMASFGGATLRGELNRAEQRNMAAQLRIYLGIALLETNDFKNAQAQFERAVKSEPTNPRYHALLGYSFLKQGLKPEAVKSLQEAVRLDQGNSDYQQLLHSAQQ